MVEGDAAEGGVADGAGLLVDFLEHEVLVAGFFGLDGVPGDALDFEGEFAAVEVGEGDAGFGEGGDFAVGEEVDVAGVVEDAGDVGGEEEFSLADAEDGRRAHAGGDEGVGRVGGEDADGEGSGEALDGAADGFVEGDAARAQALRGRRLRSRAAVLSLDSTTCSAACWAAWSSSSSWMRWAMISVSVSDWNVWPLADEGLLELEVVFDDAVVHDDEGAGAVAVGVGVLFGGAAVGGPAGVADAVGAVDGRFCDDGFEVAELAGGAAEGERLGDAGSPPTAMPAES